MVIYVGRRGGCGECCDGQTRRAGCVYMGKSREAEVLEAGHDW